VPPEGSQRNNWETTVERVERLGTRVRLRTGQPLPLTVEVTAGSQAELHLEPGARIWLAIKATEITVEPDVT
jgi:molybdate transport system ATP-binding protein